MKTLTNHGAEITLEKNLHQAPESPIRFNINYEVRVKITPHGEECLRKNHDDLYKPYRNKLRKSLYKFSLPEADEDGWTRFQMWDLMAKFGRHLSMGGELPFETEIEILHRNN